MLLCAWLRVFEQITVNLLVKKWWAKHRGPTVNSLALYSGGSGFKSQSRGQLSWLRFLVVSSFPPGNCQDCTLKSGHDHFLPNPSQFIIHLSPYHSTLYSLNYWKSTVK
jgi:hypothetical protein